MRHGQVQLRNAKILNKLFLCFYRTGNFISTIIKDHDRTLALTRSHEDTIVSQIFVFILFSHLLQGLGRLSPSLEILKPQISFFGLRTRRLAFLHLVRKDYKVTGAEF
jgi:hypothetical protein